MKNINLGAISVPLDDYASQGNAILGIRDSGKSYTATGIAERLMDSGIPIIAFDPIGIWRYLRVPGAGKGYEVVVAGGKQGDLPLTPRGAQEIVRAAMRSNVSLVLDLYDIHMSKADWRTIVASCIRTLLYENGEHGLRHIFIEEAAEFCPQQISPDQGQVYAEVEKLARMGGNALLGYTLINQRAEQVNKAVLELCDCLILHRQKGRNSINALSKWLDIATVGGGRDIIKSLPALAQGECWVWPAGSDSPVRTKVPAKKSFHPDRRARQAAPKASAGVDVSGFVTSMKGTLEALVKEAEANDPKLLRAQLAAAQRELANLSKSKGAAADPIAVAAARQEGREEGAREGYLTGLKALQPIAERVATLAGGIAETIEGYQQDLKRLAKAPPSPRQAAPAPRSSAPVREIRTPADSADVGGGAKRRVMIALAQNPDGLAARKLSILADVKRGGSTWRAVMAALRRDQYIGESGDTVHLNESGHAALGSYDPLPTGDALRQHWRSKMGAATRLAVFDAILDAHPKAISAEAVAQTAGVELGGSTWRAHMAYLRGLELISGGRGDIKASEELFA